MKLQYRIKYEDNGKVFLDNVLIGHNLEVDFSKVKDVKISEVTPKITLSLDNYLDTQNIEVTISDSKVFLNYLIDYDGTMSTRFIKFARKEYFPVLKEFATSWSLKISQHQEDALITFTKKMTDLDKTLGDITDSFSSEIDKLLTVTENAVEIPNIKFEPDYLIDETPFRDIFLERLLRALGFRGVRNTHGNKEYGKDFVFYEESLIDRKRYIALQAKAGNISGKANSDEIRTLINQIETSLLVPFPDEVNGAEHFIDTVIVAISGKYTEQAQKIIRKRLDDLITGSVIFLDGDDLVDLAIKANNK